MLREWIAAEMPEEEELKNRLEAAREKMAVQQLQMKEKKVPVLVLVEGWGTSGKGSSIGRIIQNIDPRFFRSARSGYHCKIRRQLGIHLLLYGYTHSLDGHQYCFGI